MKSITKAIIVVIVLILGVFLIPYIPNPAVLFKKPVFSFTEQSATKATQQDGSCMVNANGTLLNTGDSVLNVKVKVYARANDSKVIGADIAYAGNISTNSSSYFEKSFVVKKACDDIAVIDYGIASYA